MHLVGHLKDGGFRVKLIKPLGEGIFSVWCQSLQGVTTVTLINLLMKTVSVGLDRMFKYLLPKYKALAADFPLGYYVIASK